MSGINNVNKTKPDLGIVNLNSPAQTFNFIMVLCSIIFVSAFFFFSCLRVKLRQIYAPRLLLIENKIYAIGSMPRSFFAWISPALVATDEDIYTFSGIDALVFIRFLRLVMKLALCTLPYSMVVLLPLNIYGGNNLKDGLDKLSMSNVTKGSSKLWAHWLAVWIYTLITFYLTFHEWIVYIEYRQKYLKKGIGKQFAVLLENIPEEVTDDETLKGVLDKLFSNKISSVYFVKDLTHWDELLEQHDSYVLKLEQAKYILEATSKRPIISKYPCGPKTDAILDYETALELVQEDLLAEQQTTKVKTLTSAIVIFKSLKSRTSALQSVWNNNPLIYNASPAPDANELLWNNLKISYLNRNIRMIIGFVIIAFLVLFWTVPILFISSLTKLESVAKQFKWLESFKSGASKYMLSFIQGVVPVLLIAVFYLILPYILFAIAKFQGRISKSNMAMMVFECLFVFQTFNTFFIYIISGSLLQNLTQIINKPLELPNLMAKSLPSQAGFFLNYISLTAFVGLALELTRLVPLLWTTIKLKWFAKTSRDKLNAWKPKRPEYEVMYSQAMLFFLIGISYSILSPIIIPFFVLYFVFAYVVWMYQLLHVYISEFDHGGKFWPEVFYRMLAAVLVFQLLMLGVFLLKKSWYAAVLIAPLLVITVFFWWFMNRKYKRCGDYLVMNEASDTKYAEKHFLERVEKKYIRNLSIPDAFELSTDNKTFDDNDDYVPINGTMNDTDEDIHEMTENGRLLAR